MVKEKMAASKAGNDPAFDKEGLVSISDLLTLERAELLERLNSSEAGLDPQEAGRRLGVYGKNELVQRKKENRLVKFGRYFADPLSLILLAAGSLTVLTGDPVSAAVIFTIVVLSSSLQFVQERRAERASEELSRKVALTATVMRGGERKEVPLADLVPGDIVLLSSGDIVPAGCRILDSKDLYIDQSVLTGESFPVEKSAGALREDMVQESANWTNYLFLGTSVTGGSAKAVVVRTGRSTEYAHIVERLVQRRPLTEFERGSRRFGYLIMRVTIVLIVFVFLINVLDERDLLQSLLFSVALAVGLTPELLPMIITINLSEGALHMSRKDVVVKRLESIQNYGSMDVLCTDKTGTLTENEVAAVKFVDARGEDDALVLQLSYINSSMGTGIKSPLDAAILSHGGVDAGEIEKIDEIPFDFVRKKATVVVRRGPETILITKGAPEEVIKDARTYELKGKRRPLDQEALGSIAELSRSMSLDGLRLLAVAFRPVGHERRSFSVDDEVDLVFVGFVAFLDPPKESAKDSIKVLQGSGIELKIITGDSDLVTKKVCSEIGLQVTGVLTGRDIEKMSKADLGNAVERANIFARVNPSQKDDIILALKANGHVVGYMGDGVNDAPSIRAADVGISVNNAVDVAKGAADIILMKNDLRVLNDGVMEGRKTFGNTMKYIQMGISSNFGNMFSAAGASIFLSFLPMLPLQLLLLNLLYNLSETTIPTDNVDQEYVERPKRMNIRYIREFMIFFGPISSIYDFLTFGALIFLFHATDAMFQTAWFVESIATQTLIVFAIRTRKRPFFRSRPSLPLVVTTVLVVSFALMLPFSPLSGIFSFVPLPPSFYIFLIVFVASYFLLVELMKSLFYRRHSQDLDESEEGKGSGLGTN